MLPIFKVMFIVSNPTPLKHALNHIGFDVGNPRLPLVPLDSASADKVEKVMSKYTMDLPIRA